MTDHRRANLPSILVAFLPVLLTGCFEWKQETYIGPGGSGSFELTISNEFQEGQERPKDEELEEQREKARKDLAETRGVSNVQVRDEVTDSKITRRISCDFADATVMSSGALNQGGEGDDKIGWNVQKLGNGNYSYEQTFKAGTGEVPEMFAAALKESTIEIRVRGGGGIVSSNGEISGDTATWKFSVFDLMKSTEDKVLKAEVDPGLDWTLIGALLFGVAGVGGAVFFLTQKKKSPPTRVGGGRGARGTARRKRRPRDEDDEDHEHEHEHEDEDEDGEEDEDPAPRRRAAPGSERRAGKRDTGARKRAPKSKADTGARKRPRTDTASRKRPAKDKGDGKAPAPRRRKRF
jgi:hypothetical protein